MWFESYLKNRNYYVSIGSFASEHISMTCGVPQGSILGPLLFNISMLPLAKVMENNNISYHSYADDTQVYITLSPGDYRQMQELARCIEQINYWMCQNFLKLNEEKTEVVVFGAKDERLKVSTYLQTTTTMLKKQLTKPEILV